MLPCFTFKGLPVHAQHSGRFMEVKQRFEGWYLCSSKTSYTPFSHAPGGYARFRADTFHFLLGTRTRLLLHLPACTLEGDRIAQAVQA
jgi:hypothetical protein